METEIIMREDKRKVQGRMYTYIGVRIVPCMTQVLSYNCSTSPGELCGQYNFNHDKSSGEMVSFSDQAVRRSYWLPHRVTGSPGF